MAVASIPVLVNGIVATAAIGQFNAVTATGTVAAALGNAIGFARTAGAIGDRVPVADVGTANAIAGAAVALGALLEVGAAGKVVTKSTGVTIGRAMTAAAADGDQIEVLIIGN